MLDPIVHARLIANIEHVCSVANVPKTMLYRSAKDFLRPPELAWLTNYSQNRVQGRGLCLTGNLKAPSPETRLMAMVAALVRNFVDARLIPLNAMFEMLEGGVEVDPTVLAIPNLYLRQGGKAVPSWRMQVAYDLLLRRFTAGKLTLLYVENLDAMASEYGPLFHGHLSDHYLILTPASE